MGALWEKGERVEEMLLVLALEMSVLTSVVYPVYVRSGPN